MNQQERKYIAKRITTEEEAALVRLAAVKLTTRDPREAYTEALQALSPDQLMSLVIAAVPTTKAAAKDTLSVKTTSAHYIDGKWVEPSHLSSVTFSVGLKLGKNGQLPTGESFTGFVRLRKEEIASREKVKKQIQRTADRCRDRAMLGDGSAALEALDSFVALINELAPTA